MSKYRPERYWPRLVPKNRTTVSIYDRELGHAYGLITNLSETGACVDTGVHFEPGTTVLLRIRFSSGAEPFVTEAEIVWGRGQGNPGTARSFLHGAKFSFTTDEQRFILKGVLNSVEFRAGSVDYPDASDKLMGDLNKDQEQRRTIPMKIDGP